MTIGSEGREGVYFLVPGHAFRNFEGDGMGMMVVEDIASWSKETAELWKSGGQAMGPELRTGWYGIVIQIHSVSISNHSYSLRAFLLSVCLVLNSLALAFLNSLWLQY